MPLKQCFERQRTYTISFIEMTGVLVLLQLGFFGIVGMPLFKAITDLFKDAQPMMDGKSDCLATLLHTSQLA